MNDILHILRSASSSLRVQRLRLDVISNNIANVNSTRSQDGGPYARRLVVVEPEEARTFRVPRPEALGGSGGEMDVTGVRAQVITDDRPGPRVHEPDHPDADADGYVQYPNVDVGTEMTNALSATRSYQASVSVIDAAKQMAERALEIGRG